MKNTRTIFVFK